MENIQVLRYIANIEARIKAIENANTTLNFTTSNNLVNSIIPSSVDLTEVYNRLANLEGRPAVDLSDVNNRLANLEGRPTVDLTDVYNRLANLENRPDVMQRLSALELTVASLNSSS